MRNIYFLFGLALSSLYAFTLVGEEKAEEDLVADADFFLLSRGESVPNDLDGAPDHYLEGYIQALLDMHFYEHRVIVKVKKHKVYLYNLPKNEMLANSIISFVKDMPGVKSVEVMGELPREELEKREKYITSSVGGVWFPQSTVLFPPLVADPRQVVYSAAYRFGDRVIGTQAIAVSLGDDFPIFRWRNVGRWHGDLQIGIEAGIWSVFNFKDIHKKNGQYCELVNTDYYLGLPLTYAFDRWAFRFRIYHVSSHLGDEFLVNHPQFLAKRKNPSYEAIDFFTSYQFTKHFRGYFGPGLILHSDKTFPMDHFYVQYGAELRIWGQKLNYHRLYGTPFFAVHIENWQVRHWAFDVTAKIGYEISKLAGIGRKMRVYLTYHHGFSYEGQFFKKRTDYGEVGFSWGF
ncbi:MAG: DUF1207 domain-containing protein [Chlamydiae bacterium]|nr:DUF1207 domain-containing protein [Chlamydiota bacterium]